MSYVPQDHQNTTTAQWEWKRFDLWERDLRTRGAELRALRKVINVKDLERLLGESKRMIEQYQQAIIAQDDEVTALGQAIDFYRSAGVDELGERILWDMKRFVSDGVHMLLPLQTTREEITAVGRDDSWRENFQAGVNSMRTPRQALDMTDTIDNPPGVVPKSLPSSYAVGKWFFRSEDHEYSLADLHAGEKEIARQKVYLNKKLHELAKRQDAIYDEILHRREIASMYYYRCSTLDTLFESRRTLDSRMDDLEAEFKLLNRAIQEKEDELGPEVPDSEEERTNNAHKADSMSSVELGEAAHKADFMSSVELGEAAYKAESDEELGEAVYELD